MAEDILTSLVKMIEPEYLPTLEKVRFLSIIGMVKRLIWEEQCFQEKINPDGEVSSEMKRLFSNKWKGIDFSSTKTAALLRGVNQVCHMYAGTRREIHSLRLQEIVYPVIRELRDTFYEKFPFKDIRGMSQAIG